MGVRPLEAGEGYWYEQIKGNFLYPPGGVFANPPTATEGVLLPKPRPLRGVTSSRKEILFLYSEESVGLSQEELSSWSNIFAGVLRDLGIDPEETPKKAPAKKKTSKKVTLDTGATSKKGGSSHATAVASEKGTLRQSNLDNYVIASDSLEGLSGIGEKKKSDAAGSKNSGSAGSRALESGATPSSIPDEEEEEHEEEGPKLVTRKRTREEGAGVAQKATVVPPLGKQSRLRSLYKFLPEALKKAPKKVRELELEEPKEPEAKKPKFVIKPPRTTKTEAEKTVMEPAGDVIPEKEKVKEIETETETVSITKHNEAQGPEVVHITGLDQPLKCKGPEVTELVAATQHDAPTRTVQVTTTAGGSASQVQA
ncbi:hypothetical protein HanIR_Chr02g0065041 [Helianthus annuus]|nr:hypothetical protein HanIR_Chr02g0065041 [Helianthus annuus]